MASAEESFKKVKTLSHSESDFPLSFKINSISQKCKILSARNAILYPDKGTEHLRALGLITEDVLEPNTYFMLPCSSARPFSVHKPTLYVYSDLVRYSMVGNKLAPLLCTVAASDTLGDIVTERFTRPYYLPVSKGYISSVEIQINNDSGDLLKFISGKVVCVIHLRKVGL